MRRKQGGGYSLVEIVIASVIFGIVAAASMKAFMFISKQSVRTNERAYAVQKAIQMMEELRSLLQDENSTVSVLDDYDNGTAYKYTLSTMPEVNGDPGALHTGDRPDDPLSGNPGGSAYNSGKYKRKITIKTTNEPLSREVYVRVYRDSDGEVLAETASVLRTVPLNFVPSQVYDIFVLVLENVPGWWVSLSSLAPTFDAILQDLENRNPGLVVRVHYITRQAYGRDPYYRPFINSATRTDTVAPPWVYFLPGNVDGAYTMYTANSINGNINQDGASLSNDPSYPYPLADQYNHAVRAPEEERLYAQAVAAYTADGRTAPEISYRMLLDRMNAVSGTGPDGGWDYTNAMIINLHGEMVPMPPLRNFSDAAKRPTEALPVDKKVRVVTHPENLRYAPGSAARLRVYPFVSDPEDTADFPDNGALLPAMTVLVVSTSVSNVDIQTALQTPGAVRILDGDADTPYAWRDAAHGLGLDYVVTTTGTTGTVIQLNNTPLRHAENAADSDRGLNEADRLYGLEYIPCLIENSTFFAESSAGLDHKDLADQVADVPKNTARWTITFPAAPALGSLPDGVITFETRIGTDLATGGSVEPANVSRTYVWMGPSSSVPMSERYQFLGDPRHTPYADVKWARRFNWFFRSDISGADYPGFVRDSGGALWEDSGPHGDAEDIVMDVPRLWQVLREGLLNTNSIMTSVSGWSFYYIGLGAEMGADSMAGASYSDGIPIVGTPWVPNSGTTWNVDEISKWGGTDELVRLIAHSADGTAANTDWFGLHWIGELYPDEAAAVWVANGNLPTGNTGSDWTSRRYFRARYDLADLDMYSQNLGQAFPTTLLPMKQPGANGPGSFFNGQPLGNNAAYFNHASPTNTATLTSTGTAVSQDFNFPLTTPLTSASNNHRPFLLSETSSLPSERNESSYASLRTTVSVVESYYDSSNSGHTTSSLIRFTQGGRYGFFQPNGMAPQGSFGTAQIGKLALTNVLRGFMTLGLSSTTVPGFIPQVPLVSISSPAITDEFNNPTSITVIWSSTWTRWDGQKYTSSYPAGYSGLGATMSYNVKYSADGGSTWRFVNNPAVTTREGVLNMGYTSTSPVAWDVSNTSSFSQGNYDILVEAYRNNRGLHYTYHKRRVFIKR